MNKKIENPKITETFIDNFDFFYQRDLRKMKEKFNNLNIPIRDVKSIIILNFYLETYSEEKIVNVKENKESIGEYQDYLDGNFDSEAEMPECANEYLLAGKLLLDFGIPGYKISHLLKNCSGYKLLYLASKLDDFDFY